MHKAAFEANLREYVAKYVAMWWAARTEILDLGQMVEPRRQRHHEREADRFIEVLEDLLQGCPQAKRERVTWRGKLLTTLRQMGRNCLDYPEACLELLFSKAGLQVTREFVREAKAFDPALRVDPLLQALRNVWVTNSIQMLLEREVVLSPSIFAYSMLYPWTDNYLDDPEVLPESKLRVGDWLGRRLNGLQIMPPDSPGRQIDRLVTRIEGVYDRAEFEEVHWSLRAIHQAQMKSLGQQGPDPLPGAGDLLQISVEKGGTSVLADAYLVSGRLSEEEADFMFGYGVLLQLLDDLQDVQGDLQSKHLTLFTQCAAVGTLDEATRRLCQLIPRVLLSSERFSAPRFEPLKGLIQRNCVLWVLQAVAYNQELYSARFLKESERYSPFSFAYLRRRRITLTEKYAKLSRTLRRRNRFDSVFEVLD